MTIDTAVRVWAIRYGVAIGMSFAAFAIRLGLDPFLGVHAPFLFFLPTVVIAAAFGGFGPGFLASTLGFLGGAAFVPLDDGLAFEESVNIAAYWGMCVLLAWFGQRLQKAQKRATSRAIELAEREAHLQSILDTVPDGMIVFDERGIIQSCSRAAERLFGCAAHKMIGRNVAMLLSSRVQTEQGGNVAQSALDPMQYLQQKGRVADGVRNDGTVFPIELFVGEMIIGNKRSFTGFVRDLTEWRKNELRMQELHAELVYMSRLTAVGELASSLAHEINQPLAAIGNYLSGARRLLSKPSAENLNLLRTAIGEAADQAVRAGDFIRRLRKFVSRGKSAREVGSLSKIVEDAGALALSGAREQGAAIRVNLDPTADRIIADRIQVQQVLISLIRNAIEAMEATERKELIVSSQAKDGGWLEISVSDTGSGLADKVADRLFQPFVTSKPAGIGVGLSICRTIVESHGGKIWVESPPEGGCVFRFTLPNSKVMPRAAKPSSQGSSLSRPNSVR